MIDSVSFSSAILRRASAESIRISHVLDALVRRFRPKWVNRLSGFLALRYERFAPISALVKPSGGHLCVIAPHPDDESIGCGGLIAAWRAGGGTVTVFVLTDGAAGDPSLRDPNLTRAEREVRATRIAETRKQEMQAALKILKARGVWLDGTDDALTSDVSRLAPRLSDALRDAPPDAIAAPFPADRHADHIAAARILAAADIEPATEILAYEVWSPARINTVLDMTDWSDTKWAAIACHASQTATTDYAAAARGLATYRAVSAGLGADRFAEGYWKTTLAEYRTMTRALTV